MKKLIAFLLVPFLMACAAAPVPVPASEQAHALKVLWFNQKLFGLTQGWIDLKVRHIADMKERGVWGDVYFDDSGAHIEIMAVEDMPEDFPAANRERFQEEVIQHEVMHVKLTSMGVPDEWQDRLIRDLQPSLQKVK